MSTVYLSNRVTPEPRDTDSLMASNSQNIELKEREYQPVNADVIGGMYLQYHYALIMDYMPLSIAGIHPLFGVHLSFSAPWRNEIWRRK